MTNDKTVFDSGATQPEDKPRSLDDLLAELETVARERLRKSPASSATVPDPSATVYESAPNAPNPSATVYESAGTVPDSATRFDDGAMTAAALSDAAGRTDAPASNLSIQKGETILDTYRIESDAIEGGMGSVWRVRHTGWNADLAMKRPLPACFATEKSKADFIHECEAWIKLGLHPNIVSCYYVREISGTPSIFSEWMDGGSLEGAIKDGTLYAGTEAAQQARILDIAIQFARGLHYAHEAGLIHQDVKPDNLLLSKDGDAKVADFGLARARAVLTQLEGSPTTSQPADSGKTIASPAGGYTPAYCSMEQMDGKTLTRRTDIYSWAVSVMELYIGSRPWANGVVAGLSCRGYFEDTKLPMPEALKELLAKCMETEPDDRPHDFAEIESKLQEIYRAETGGDYPRPAPKAATDTADSLNNRALSMLDLGKPEEANRYWESALALAPFHTDSRFNSTVHGWRSGVLTDEQAVNRLLGHSYFSESEDGQAALMTLAREAEKQTWTEPLFPDAPSRPFPGPLPSSVSYVPSYTRLWHGKLCCVIAESGSEKSRRECIAGIYCYEAMSGKLLWQDDLQPVRAEYGDVLKAVLSQDGEMAFLSVSDNRLLCYNVANRCVDRVVQLCETPMYCTYGQFDILGPHARYARRMISSGIGHGPPGYELWDLFESRQIPDVDDQTILDAGDGPLLLEQQEALQRKRSDLSLTDGLSSIRVGADAERKFRCDQNGAPIAPLNPRIRERHENGVRTVLRIYDGLRLWQKYGAQLFNWDVESGKCLRSYRLDDDKVTLLFDADGLHCVGVRSGEQPCWQYRAFSPVVAAHQAAWTVSRIESLQQMQARERQLARLLDRFTQCTQAKDSRGACSAYREALENPRFMGGPVQRSMADALDTMQGVTKECTAVRETLQATMSKATPAESLVKLSDFGFAALPAGIVERIRATGWIVRKDAYSHAVRTDGRQALFCGQGLRPGGSARAPLGTGVYLLDIPSDQLHLVAPVTFSAYTPTAHFTRDGRHVVYCDGRGKYSAFSADTGETLCAATENDAPHKLAIAPDSPTLLHKTGLFRFQSAAEMDAFITLPGKAQVLDSDGEKGLIAYAANDGNIPRNFAIVRIWDVARQRHIFQSLPMPLDYDAIGRFSMDTGMFLLAPHGFKERFSLYTYQLSYRYTEGERRQLSFDAGPRRPMQLAPCDWPMDPPKPAQTPPAPSKPAQPPKPPITPQPAKKAAPVPEEKPAEKKGLFGLIGKQTPKGKGPYAFLFYCKTKAYSSDELNRAQLGEMLRIGATVRQFGCTAAAKNTKIFTPDWNSAVYSRTDVQGQEANDLVAKIKAAVAQKGFTYHGETIRSFGFTQDSALGAAGLFIAWYQTQ